MKEDGVRGRKKFRIVRFPLFFNILQMTEFQWIIGPHINNFPPNNTSSFTYFVQGRRNTSHRCSQDYIGANALSTTDGSNLLLCWSSCSWKTGVGHENENTVKGLILKGHGVPPGGTKPGAFPEAAAGMSAASGGGFAPGGASSSAWSGSSCGKLFYEKMFSF